MRLGSVASRNIRARGLGDLLRLRELRAGLVALGAAFHEFRIEQFFREQDFPIFGSISGQVVDLHIRIPKALHKAILRVQEAGLSFNATIILLLKKALGK